MLRYNYEAIYRVSKGKCNIIIILLKHLCGISKKSPTARELTMLGKLKGKPTNSYIINPEELLNSNYAITDICVYISLASKRNYADYIISNNSSLPTFIIDDIFNIEKLKRNKLLDIDDSMIHFKY